MASPRRSARCEAPASSARRLARKNGENDSEGRSEAKEDSEREVDDKSRLTKSVVSEEMQDRHSSSSGIDKRGLMSWSMRNDDSVP